VLSFGQERVSFFDPLTNGWIESPESSQGVEMSASRDREDFRGVSVLIPDIASLRGD
jgi:hypothetical protein